MRKLVELAELVFSYVGSISRTSKRVRAVVRSSEDEIDEQESRIKQESLEIKKRVRYGARQISRRRI